MRGKVMRVLLLKVTARCAVLEIEDGGNYYTKEAFAVILNGKEKRITDRSVTVIDGLIPGKEYALTVENSEGKAVCDISFQTPYESVTLNVKEMGASGDGLHDDTVIIQSAIMACPKDGRVLLPKGKYLVSSLFLRDGLNLELAEDAEIVAITDRKARAYFPGEIQTADEKEEILFGTWEGNPRPMFAGIINGFGVKDVTIYGKGTINGNASKEDWWKNPKIMDTAYRPRTVFLKDCKGISLIGIKIINSPSWTIHPFFSENLEFYGLTIRNPEDSPNTDGIDPECCSNVKIKGVHFSLGDDCIAVKSGKIYLAEKFKKASENIEISGCLMENGHGAVTLGSEIAGGVYHLLVHHCLFVNTDRGLRVKTRRGRGRLSVLDDIVFEEIQMEKVKNPFTVNCFYFCDPDGKTGYVQSRDFLPADERTPEIGTLTFHRITAKDCSVSAMYVEGLPEKKIGRISLEDIRISFTQGECNAEVPIMSSGTEPCSKKGITMKNVHILRMKNVTVEGMNGEAMDLAAVDEVQNDE